MFNLKKKIRKKKRKVEKGKDVDSVLKKKKKEKKIIYKKITLLACVPYFTNPALEEAI